MQLTLHVSEDSGTVEAAILLSTSVWPTDADTASYGHHAIPSGHASDAAATSAATTDRQGDEQAAPGRQQGPNEQVAGAPSQAGTCKALLEGPPGKAADLLKLLTEEQKKCAALLGGDRLHSSLCLANRVGTIKTGGNSSRCICTANFVLLW